ncbi:alpha-L-rhamnosidase N-terminal domain-containing protein [Bacteroidota bacterium]
MRKESGILFGLCFLIQIISVNAQESEYKVNLDWEHERHAWSSFWVTHPTASVYDYGIFLFRNKFELNSVPDKFIIYVSADNRYRLFVNGKEIAMGPAKGSLQYWRYETIDIAEYLNKGENIIAAEVFNLGEFRPAAQFSNITAFILQSEEFRDILNTGTGNWKVTRNEAYQAIPVSRDMIMGKYYVAGPCDKIVASKYPWGWETLQFEDSGWLSVKNVQLGCGRGYMHGSPWWLVPRNIPMMEQKHERFANVVRAKGTQIGYGFIKQNQHLDIPPNTKAEILLDHGWLTVGFPEMITAGGRGSSIKVTYAEALYGQDGTKGNRNDTREKEIAGYYDIFLPDGGDSRLFKPLWLRTYRYVQLNIQTGDEPLRIVDYYGIFTRYPFEQKAVFKSENADLRNIWNVSWRTARSCAGETYMDCPYWEQLQYLGDARIQSLISLYVTGDDRLMRNALLQADHSRMPNGLTMARGPSAVPQVTPPFSLFWIDMVHDYYMHREDDEFLRQFLPGISAVLGWFERRLDDNGILGSLDWLNFSDWTTGFNCGSPAGVDDGNSALISLKYVYALDRASELFYYFGMNVEGDKYKNQAESVRKAVYRECYDTSRGLIADVPQKNVFSQHTNIFAILSDAVPQEMYKDIMSKVLEDQSLIQTTIYFKFYLFQALKEAGMADLYLGQLGPWHEMLGKGLTTWEEGDYDERSDCHAWGSSPMYDFLATVCGIRPLSPGFKTVMIEPAFGPLPKLDARIPHPGGEIHLLLEKKGKSGVKGLIILPQGLNGKFMWGDDEVSLKAGENEINSHK